MGIILITEAERSGGKSCRLSFTALWRSFVAPGSFATWRTREFLPPAREQSENGAAGGPKNREDFFSHDATEMNKGHPKRSSRRRNCCRCSTRSCAAWPRRLTARLTPGQTLQPTALVHEAYLRLVRDQDPGWEGRRHFFGAAAQAMREILIEQARHKGSLKHGGQAQRRRAGRGPGLDRTADRRSARPGRGDPAAPGGGRATGGDRPAPLLHRPERGGNGQRGRRVGQHLEARLALCAGLVGAAPGRRHALIGDGIGIPQAIGEPMTEQHRLRVRALFAQAADLPAGRTRRLPGRRLSRRTRPPRRSRRIAGLRLRLRNGDGRGRLPEKPTGPRAEGTPSESSLPPQRDRAWAAGFTSAAIASSAGTAKVAWAPSTRQNRTTRAAPSPSR